MSASVQEVRRPPFGVAADVPPGLRPARIVPPAEGKGAILARLLAKVEEMRPHLRAEQANCESRGHPSAEVHRAFVEAGLFRVMTPRRFGGYELGLDDFYTLVMAVARSCPSTGWWYALGAGHVVQIASYFSEEAQREILGGGPDFSAPWSFNGRNVAMREAEGGYVVSGTWAYSSGAPHASHFMGGTPLVQKGDNHVWNTPVISFVVPRGQFEVLDDWGDLLGMKGSGSNGVRLTDVFVPHHMTLVMDRSVPMLGDTPGTRLHGNPLYGGLLNGFVEGGLAAMAVGTLMAAIDEYVAIVTTKKAGRTETLRYQVENFQRTLGLALATADSARAIVLHGAALYHAHAADSVAGISAFDHEKGLRMDGMYHTAEGMVWQTVQDLLKGASSSALRDGERMQRYFRDVSTLCTRRDQLDYRAANIAVQYLRKLGHEVG